LQPVVLRRHNADPDELSSLALDLVLFMDLARRARTAESAGVAVLLFQGACDRAGILSRARIFIQLMKLQNTLRWMKSEELIMPMCLAITTEAELVRPSKCVTNSCRPPPTP
jgi:hypothetical protein